MRLARLAAFLFLGIAIPVSLGFSQTGIVTGTILQPNGLPLAGADLDFFFPNGNEQKNVSGDYTTASGVFTTTIPQGTYDILVKPPTGMLVQQLTIPGVVIGAFQNVGTAQTAAGAGVQGTLTGPGGVALGGCSVKIEVAATGAALTVPGTGTDLAGHFQFVVPPGTYHFYFDTSALGTLAAPGQNLGVACPASAWTNLGAIALSQGYVLAASLKKQAGGAPVADCDIDVRNPATGQKLYTPGDNSDGLGFVDVVVPAGVWLVDVTPDFQTGLVAKRISPVVVAGPASLGDVFLEPGIVVSGTVRNTAGAPVAGADLDAYRWPSGEYVLTVNDDTSGAGAYQVLLPAGALTLVFDPIGSLTEAPQTHAPQLLTGPATVDCVLPKFGFTPSSHQGFGHAGTAGIAPVVGEIGVAAIGNTHYALTIQQALASSPATVLVGENPGLFPFPDFDVTFQIDLFTSFSLDAPSDASGTALYAAPVPNNPALVGLDFFAQGLVFDPGATKLFSHTDALRIVVTD